jgi:hypothetical protein
MVGNTRKSAEFKADVVRECCAALESEGFIQYRRGNVDLPLTANFHCWVGLNTRLTPEFVDINPFIGLHSVDIEKLWTSIKTGKYKTKYDRGLATYSVHFGTLLPNEPIFRFSIPSDIGRDARRLAKIYAKEGVEFSRSIASYESLLPYLLERAPSLGGFPERVASCLYFMNRYDEAEEFITKVMTSQSDYFEGFATSFLRLPEFGGGGGITVTQGDLLKSQPT